MKIGIDARVLLDKNYSGVANFTFYLLKNLLKIDKSNTYSFFYNSFKSLELPILSDNKIEIIKTSYPNKLFNYFFQKIFNFPKLDKVIGQSDVFYSPHINFSSFSNKTKSVITIHDLSFLHYPEFFSFRKNLWHQAINIKKSINKYNKIVAVSQNTKNDIIELLKVPEKKIEVIYPGLPDYPKNDKEWPDDYLKTEYGINSDYILYFGTIEPRKNISGLISAYNLLRDKGLNCLLVLVGAWGWKTKEVKNKWQSSKYKDDIKFIGYISDELKPLFYKQATVLAYPSFYEGFGFPPLEAMYFNLPVVAGNVSSLPEILGDSAILVNPDKPQDLAEALEMVLKDENLRNKMKVLGQKRISKFSWSDTAQKYLNLFNKLNSKE